MTDHDHNDCISRGECTRLMDGLWDAIGKDDKSGMRGDVRSVRDAVNADAAVRADSVDRQEKNNGRIQLLLTLLTIIITISTASSYWTIVKTIFTSFTHPLIFQHTEVRPLRTASMQTPQSARK